MRLRWTWEQAARFETLVPKWMTVEENRTVMVK